MTRVQLELALQAFRAGFAAATSTTQPAKPLTGMSAIAKHWRRGFSAGRAALDSEETAYRKELSK